METNQPEVAKPAQPKPPNFALFAFLISGLTFLLLAVFYVSMNEQLDKLNAQQDAIATHISLIENGGIPSIGVNPFCYGYDANGQKRLGINPNKVTVACGNGTG